MKKIALVLCIILTGLVEAYSQSACCSSAPNAFASLGNESEFVLQHEEPLPYTLVSEKGQMISFAATDGKSAKAYAIKSQTESKKYLIVFHEWWGLNDYIKSFAEKFYTDLENVNVIAVDLYDGNVATTRQDAQTYMQSLSVERGIAILDGLLNHIGKDAEIATVGWCMGGGWSMQMALEAKGLAKGAIMYYGMPEQNTDRLNTIQCPVLFFHAAQDKWINDEVVSTFKKNMQSAGKKLQVEEYDADHAFANPSNPSYNKEAAADAYSKSLLFLRKVL